jgi:hypothetical protein
MNTVDVGGAIAWGAMWRQLLKPRTDNPFPDAPGWYVKRKAWFFGYDNAVDVLSKSDGLSPDDPVYDDIRTPARSRLA